MFTQTGDLQSDLSCENEDLNYLYEDVHLTYLRLDCLKTVDFISRY